MAARSCTWRRIARHTRALRRLGAVAKESSFVFSTEVFGWRTFANRRELAGSVGIVGTPFKSGEVDQEQGISKAGNKRMRTMLVATAAAAAFFAAAAAALPD